MCSFAGRAVTCFNDNIWRAVRQRDELSDDFLADPNFIGPFKAGGGKGGDLMAFTTDGSFIIKELSKGDHECLQNITESFVERIIGGNSLIVTIYMHFEDRTQEPVRTYKVMRNIFRHKGPYAGLYDLKGCDDDKTLEANGRKVKAVHKRIWHLHMWCGNCAWSDDRMTYYQGKVAARTVNILLTTQQKRAVVSRLKMDTDWLAEKGLMDYSLLVGVKRITQAEFDSDDVARWSHAAPNGELRQPLLCRVEPTSPGPDGAGVGDITLVYIGIIDFLQAWTMGKKIAMVLKTFERKKATVPPDIYGQRFYEHFERSIKSGATPVGRNEEGAHEWTPSSNRRMSRDPTLQDFPEETRDQMHAYYSCRSMESEKATLQPSKGCAPCFSFVKY